MGTLINPEFNVDLRTIGLYDLGDVSKGSTLEAAHTALEQRVRSILDADSSVIPFVVGGSNDQSYPNAAALMGHLGHGDVSIPEGQERACLCGLSDFSHSHIDLLTCLWLRSA
jgi:arginase family enzyme